MNPFLLKENPHERKVIFYQEAPSVMIDTKLLKGLTGGSNFDKISLKGTFNGRIVTATGISKNGRLYRLNTEEIIRVCELTVPEPPRGNEIDETVAPRED